MAFGNQSFDIRKLKLTETLEDKVEEISQKVGLKRKQMGKRKERTMKVEN